MTTLMSDFQVLPNLAHFLPVFRWPKTRLALVALVIGSHLSCLHAAVMSSVLESSPLRSSMMTRI